VIAQTTVRTAAERRLVNALRGKNDFPAVIGIFDAAPGGAFMHRLSDLRLRPAHEALPVREVLSAWVQAAVDYVHFRLPSKVRRA
jgi:hypothetical protein